ncbi:MAG: hypothetical protein ACP5FT_04545 [Acidilobus sp.]
MRQAALGERLGERVSPCDRDELEHVLLLARLARLSFTDQELERICLEVRSIRVMLSRVKKFRDLNVRPLYNVWDEELSPPDRVEETDRTVKLSWLDKDRIQEGKVRVPWRGG